MRLYVEVFVEASGSTLTVAEKYSLIPQKLNEIGIKGGMNIDRKIDTIKRKGEKNFKIYRQPKENVTVSL